MPRRLVRPRQAGARCRAHSTPPPRRVRRQRVCAFFGVPSDAAHTDTAGDDTAAGAEADGEPVDPRSATDGDATAWSPASTSPSVGAKRRRSEVDQGGNVGAHRSTAAGGFFVDVDADADSDAGSTSSGEGQGRLGVPGLQTNPHSFAAFRWHRRRRGQAKTGRCGGGGLDLRGCW